MKKKSGQAAVEFLFTYGWAIMAITISIGALTYFNVLTPDRFVQKYCDFGSQFECNEMAVYDNGSMIFFVTNNHRVDVELNNITIFANAYIYTQDLADLTIQRGEQVNFTLNTGQGALLRRGDTHEFRTEVNYNRVGGSNNYYFSGRVFAGVLGS